MISRSTPNVWNTFHRLVYRGGVALPSKATSRIWWGLKGDQHGEVFHSLREVQVIIESWRRHYNSVRPHAWLGYRPPAPEVFMPAFAAWPVALTQPASPAMLPVAQRPTLN
jgi:transposase InsO family protein